MEPIMTVDGVLVNNGRVLLIERTKPPFEDKLVFPGGHVEPGESCVEAVVRELQEEVGVEVAARDLQFLIKLDAPDRDPRPVHRVAQVYWVAVADGVLESAVAGSVTRAVHLVDIHSVKPEQMGFDHYRALEVLTGVM